MTRSLGGESRDIVPSDERPHEHGGEAGWVERFAFNFFDDASGYAGLLTLDYRPAERKAFGEVDVFLPGGGVATSLARANDAKRGEMTVGRLTFECTEEMRSWRLACNDTALVFPSAESASLAAQTERAGKAAHLEFNITFEAWTDPAGWGIRRTDINDEGFTSIVSTGWFEQAGGFTGHLRVGPNSVDIAAHGFRARSWGVPVPGGYWYAVAFGKDVGVSMANVKLAGESVTHGRLYRGGKRYDWSGSGRQSIAGGVLDMMLDDVGGQDIHVTGDILATIPPRPNHPEVYRSLTRFHLGARTALGLVETGVLSL